MVIREPRVVFVLPNLQAGGAQRVVLELANELSSSIDVTLALITPNGDLLRHVWPAVRIVELGGRMVWISTLLRMLWRTRPQAVLSTIWDVNIGVLLMRPMFPAGMRVVVREVLMPEGWVNDWHCPRLTRALYRYAHKRADRVIVLSQAMRQRFIEFTGLRHPDLVVIPNGTGVNHVAEPDVSIPFLQSPYIIAVGRLERQKGFDILIEAFSRLEAQYAPYRLVIVGEGGERERLTALIGRHHLHGRVILTGFVSNPLPLVKQATLFVLSSHIEGMPNALVEAICVGTPALATRENTSADEIIIEAENGFLVRRCEIDALVSGLRYAILAAPSFDRVRIAQKARERFSLRVMVDGYRRALLD